MTWVLWAVLVLWVSAAPTLMWWVVQGLAKSQAARQGQVPACPLTREKLAGQRCWVTGRKLHPWED